MRPSRHDIWDHLDPGTPLAALIAITDAQLWEDVKQKIKHFESFETYCVKDWQTNPIERIVSELAGALRNLASYFWCHTLELRPWRIAASRGFLALLPRVPVGPPQNTARLQLERANRARSLGTTLLLHGCDRSTRMHLVAASVANNGERVCSQRSQTMSLKTTAWK